MEWFLGGRGSEAVTAIASTKRESAIHLHHSSCSIVHSVEDVPPRCLKHRPKQGVLREQPTIPIVSGHPNVRGGANPFPSKFVCARDGAPTYSALGNGESRTLLLLNGTDGVDRAGRPQSQHRWRNWR